MKHISWVKFWLLGYITFGIYPLVIWCRMTKQQNRMADMVGQKTIMGFIGAYLLGCITFGIVPFVWLIKFCKQQVTLAEAKGIKLRPTNSTFVLWLLLCVPIYSFIVLSKNHNRLVDAYSVKEQPVVTEVNE